MVYSRIGRRVRKHGLVRFQDYLGETGAGQRRPGVGSVHQRPDHHTSPPSSARAITSRCSPDLVRERRGPVRVWSAGASTGEEPYSIAMALTEVLGDKGRFPGSRHRYRHRGPGTGPGAASIPWTRSASSTSGGASVSSRRAAARAPGLARVRPEVAARVRFQTLNLVAPKWPRGGSLRCDLLPQRDDLFRQGYPGPHPRPLRAFAQARRAIVRRSFRKLFLHQRMFSAARSDLFIPSPTGNTEPLYEARIVGACLASERAGFAGRQDPRGFSNGGSNKVSGILPGASLPFAGRARSTQVVILGG